MVCGWRPLGSVPALKTSKRSPARLRSRPSAIWLLAELPVQRNRTLFLVPMCLLIFMRKRNGLDLLRQVRDQPLEQRCRQTCSQELGTNKGWNVGGANPRKCIGSCSGESNGRIGKGS